MDKDNMPKLNWLNEETYKDETEHIRNTNGKYSNIIRTFGDCDENFAKIRCKDQRQAWSVCQAFRNEIRHHNKKWKVRSHYEYVYVEKLE